MGIAISYYDEDPNTVTARHFAGDGHPWIDLKLSNGSDMVRLNIPADFALSIGRAIMAHFPAVEVEPEVEPAATTGPVCDHCGRAVMCGTESFNRNQWVHSDTGKMADCTSHGASSGPGYAEVNGTDVASDYEAALADTNVADLV